MAAEGGNLSSVVAVEKCNFLEYLMWMVLEGDNLSSVFRVEKCPFI